MSTRAFLCTKIFFVTAFLVFAASTTHMLNADELQRYDKPVYASVYIYAPFSHGDLLKQVESALLENPDCKYIRLDLRDPKDIQAILRYTPDLTAAVPTQRPHGYRALCAFDVRYQSGFSIKVATNYTFWSKEGGGDWEVVDGLEPFIYQILLDDDKRRDITIGIDPKRSTAK